MFGIRDIAKHFLYTEGIFHNYRFQQLFVKREVYFVYEYNSVKHIKLIH